MTIPPSIKTLLPSLKITEEGGKSLAALSLADLRKLVPSLEIMLDGGRGPMNGNVQISIGDLRNVLGLALSGVKVDEPWYISQVAGLSKDLQSGKFKSVADHYYMHGYLEGRLPEKPFVDEKFYLFTYPDVAAAIKAGLAKSAFDHFVKDGYSEGRMATPK